MQTKKLFLLCCVIAAGLALAGCHSSGSGYRADVYDDGSARIEYLGATLEINEGEFIDDDDFEEHFFCLHMTYINDLGNPSSDMDDEFEKDSLDASFVIRAIQGDKVFYPRSEVGAETFEEENCYERIEQGDMIECEMYFEVDTSRPVTIQVLNPDGEDVVMAELEYSPGERD